MKSRLFKIRKMEESDIPEVINLLSGSLSNKGATKKTADFWRWKHERSPFGPSICYVAVSKSENSIIGIRCLMPFMSVSPNDDLICCFRPVDTATREDWRGMGVFNDLTTHVLRVETRLATSVIFNTPNPRSLPGYVKMGWKVIQHDSVYVYWLSIFSKLIRAVGFRGVHRLDASCKDLSCQEISNLSDFCANSFNHKTSEGLRILRNNDYIQWRYFDYPGDIYRVIVLFEKSNISAVGFYRVVQKKGVYVAIVSDVFSANHSLSGHLSAIKTICSITKSMLAVFSASSCSVDRAGVVWPKFLKVRDVPVAGRFQDESTNILFDLSLGDIDIF